MHFYIYASRQIVFTGRFSFARLIPALFCKPADLREARKDATVSLRENVLNYLKRLENGAANPVQSRYIRCAPPWLEIIRPLPG